MSRSPIPKYRRDSQGRAFVQHRLIPSRSRRMYLGRWGSPESIERYKTFLAKLDVWKQAPPISAPPQRDNEIDILIAAYLEWSEVNYRRP